MSAGPDVWGYCELRLPLDRARVVPGSKVPVSGSDKNGTKYNGEYTIRIGDLPGTEVMLHFRMDSAKPPGSVVNNVAFISTGEWENLQNARAAPITATLGAPGEDVETATRPKLVCERVLARLLACALDGRDLQLVRLRGSLVPADTELYFCSRTFTTLQVRAKVAAQANGFVHDYAFEPESIDTGRGGVYDLRGKGTDHQLQVKVQPTLGLQSLLPPLAGSASSCAEALLLTPLPSLLGACELLLAFVRDSARENVTFREGPKMRHLPALSKNSKMLQALVEKVPVLSCQGSCEPQVVRVAEPSKPRTRGMLLKAFFEVKMLLLRAVAFMTSGSLSQPHRDKLDALLMAFCEDCCPGGVDEQYEPEGPSAMHLRALVCGPALDGPAWDEAWRSLYECTRQCKSTYLPAIHRHNVSSERLCLSPPTMELIRKRDGATFKKLYNQIWRQNVVGPWYSRIHEKLLLHGPATTKSTLHKNWSAPDTALRLLCPSHSLEETIETWERELGRLVDSMASTGAVGEMNDNPRGACGLDNPGENLCATNAMLQVLFSVERFRSAVLRIPDLGDSQRPKAGCTEPDAKQLIESLYRLFNEMLMARCASTSALEVAMVLYEREIGQQQDSDELLLRLSSLVDDGLKAIAGDPYGDLRQTFRRLLVGETYEVHVRVVGASPETGAKHVAQGFRPIAEVGASGQVIGYPLAEDAFRKKFLTIPVQGGNQSLAQALEDFTQWSSTGGSDVLWVQEQFRSLPPFLCFASRQVTNLEWEGTLNLTPFTAQATPSMQRDLYERARLRQVRNELSSSLQHLSKGQECLKRAEGFSDQLLNGEVRSLEDLVAQLQTRLDGTSQDLNAVDDKIGDGFGEPTLAEFLTGVIDGDIVEEKIHGLLGVNTIKKLSDLVLGVDGAEDMLEDLGLEASQVRALLLKLGDRQRSHCEHMYDIHAVIVYQGRGQVGHYVSFVRQVDGTFLCFDDNRVIEYSDVDKVRHTIAERSKDVIPASVRMLIYRRCGSDEPLIFPGPDATPCRAEAEIAADPIGIADKGDDPKRRRLE